MKKLLVLAGVAVSLGAGSAMAQDQAKSCPAVKPEQIEALFNDFNAAWATKDPAKVTALFTKNPVLLATVSDTPRDTPEEVQDYFVSFLKNSPVGTINTSEIEIDCNTASRVGTWTVTLTDAATGTKTDVKARYSFIYRYEDGSWKIDHLHSSMMPEGSAKN
jgi:uncharacterized protein (TIGR02246 family)